MRGLQFEYSYVIEFRNPIELYANKGYGGFDFHKGRDPIDIGVTLIFITNEGSKIVKVRPQK